MTEPQIRPLTVGEYRQMVKDERAEAAKPEEERELFAVQIKYVALATNQPITELETLSPGTLGDLYGRLIQASLLKPGEAKAVTSPST